LLSEDGKDCRNTGEAIMVLLTYKHTVWKCPWMKIQEMFGVSIYLIVQAGLQYEYLPVVGCMRRTPFHEIAKGCLRCNAPF